jgi:hypothetical protein
VAEDYTIFEYLYRDAGNYKAFGELLLEGLLEQTDVAKFRGWFESGEYFIAEQLAIPTLYDLLWAQCENGPSAEDDHVWHEFCGVREATKEEITTLEPWGSAAALLAALANVKAWDVSLSRNWRL